MTKIQVFLSLDHDGGRSILSEDNFTYSRTIKSKIFEKQRATAVHTSRDDFDSFFAIFFANHF
jgi:hypothetical protein